MSGISQMLDELATACTKAREHHKHQDQISGLVNEIKNKHHILCEQLKISGLILDPLFDQLREIITSCPQDEGWACCAFKANVMAMGECILTTIGHAFLEKCDLKCTHIQAQQWLCSRHQPHPPTSLAADEYFLSASCDYNFDPSLQSECLNSKADVFLTQGFLARDHQNHTVLLGRGGSDTSATCLAAKLGAIGVQIWTDVPGIFTAHPKEIPDSRLLLQLSYQEAQELASCGAKVLHPRCIEPLTANQIPLSIRWTQRPNLKMTTQVGDFKQPDYSVKGICSKKNITVFSMDTIQMWQQAGFLANVFSIFKQFHLSCDTISTSETNLTVTVHKTSQYLDENTLHQLSTKLSEICHLKVFDDCVTISLVGEGIRSILHRLASILKVFEDRKVFMVSQAANNLNLSFTVTAQDSNTILKQLHDHLFVHISDPHAHIFGHTWQDINDPQQLSQHDESTQPQPNNHLLWWVGHRDEITRLVSESLTTPAYITHLPTVNQRAQDLKQIQAVDQFFYAMKANPHPAVIQLIENMGFGFDCVSLGEINHLKRHLKNFDPQKIIFTPNFAPITEYIRAFEEQITVTVDNLQLLRDQPDLFRHKQIMIRMDLGTRQGHHHYVKTAGDQSKFGIPLDQTHALIETLKTHKITLKGVHFHQGSGIQGVESWKNSAYSLIQWASSVPAFCKNNRLWIDVGGGLAVAEKPHQSSPVCVKTLAEALAEVKSHHPHITLAMEPGRYLVAEAGIIVCQVHQTKTKGDHHYVGVDAGMHTLIRPALYGAYHHICHLNPPPHADKGPQSETVHIVGPICESGDVIARSRLMKKITVGDRLVICGAGAYGRVMSSNYNHRGYPDEFIMDT